MKPDGVEARIGPVLGTPRRSRDRVRIALVGAAAVIVVGAGIGLAGNGLTVLPSATGSPGTSGSAAILASHAATATPGDVLPPPTRSSVLECAPVRFGKPPEIRLTANPESMIIVGVAAPAPSASTGPDAPPWPTLPLGGALRALGDLRAFQSSLDLSSVDDGCMRYVLAEYAPSVPGGATSPIAFPIPFRTLNVSPPRSIVPLGPLPPGDWTVRIVAYFSTGQAGQEDGSVIERFFRVVTSESAGPIPALVTSPAVACGPLPRGGGTPTLVLVGAVGGPVEGALGATVPPPVPVRIGDPLEIRVAGDACALGWAIAGAQVETGFNTTFDQQDNASNDPFLYAQNRWPLHDLPTGRMTVGATIRFSADVSVTNRWFLDVAGADVPTIRIVTPNGSTTPTVRALCGATWVFTAGASGFEFCAANEVPDGLPVLSVPPETPLRIEAPGWIIRTWGGSCGRLDPASSGQMLSVNGCDLGGWYGDRSLPIPGPAVFLPRTAGPLVRIFVQAERNGTVATVVVFLTVQTTS